MTTSDKSAEWASHLTSVSAVMASVTALAGLSYLPKWLIWISAAWVAFLILRPLCARVSILRTKWLASRELKAANSAIAGELHIALDSLSTMVSRSHSVGIGYFLNEIAQERLIPSPCATAHRCHLDTLAICIRELKQRLIAQLVTPLEAHRQLMDIASAYLDICANVNHSLKNLGTGADMAAACEKALNGRNWKCVVTEANEVSKDLVKAAKRANQSIRNYYVRDHLPVLE